MVLTPIYEVGVMQVLHDPVILPRRSLDCTFYMYNTTIGFLKFYSIAAGNRKKC